MSEVVPGSAAGMPRYRSHKEVWALRIERLVGDVMHFSEKGFAPRQASSGLFARYRPVSGDYFVVYDDGYESISPKAAFESGYTRLYDAR